MTYLAYNSINIGRLSSFFTSKNGIDYFSFLIFLIIGQCLYIGVFTLLAHRKTIKPVVILLSIMGGAATYFVNRYGIAIDRSMVLNVLNTNYLEASSFLSTQMIPYFLLFVIAPVTAVFFIKVDFGGESLKYIFKTAKVFGLSFLVALGLLYVKFNDISRAVNSSNKYVVQALVPINCIQSIISLMQTKAEAYYRSQRKIEFKGRVKSVDDLVVVLAVGETSRQKNFNLYGYTRKETNPLLSKDKNIHVLNGVARLGSTLYALPEILNKKDVPLPLMTSKVGIETACYVNYTMYDACDAVGEVAVSNCGHGGQCYDEDVIPLLVDNLKTYKSGYRFVVLHLGGGSHGPSYHLRHPPEFQKFKPMCLDADVVNKCTEEELYNSYDNTILYVDSVVSRIIGELDQSKVPYVFIYLSDHGESLLEEGRVFHGTPLGVNLPPEQAHIPLLVKSSVPLTIDQRAEYQQRDVFDTIATLFKIEGEILNPSASFIIRK